VIPGLRQRAADGAPKGLFAGALFGLACITVAIGLQFWNEGRAQRRATVLEAAAEMAMPVAQTKGSAALVHASGRATAASPVQDPVFDVSAQALGLRRTVEMFQWVERREKRSEKRADGSTREYEVFRYEQAWSDDYQNSNDFNQPDGHRNPPAPMFSSEQFKVAEVRVDARPLDPLIAADIDGWEALPVTPAQLPPNLAASFSAADGWLFSGESIRGPALGDVRIRFEQIPEGPVSLLAALESEQLRPATVASDSAFFLIARGEQGAPALIEDARSANSVLAWVLRVGGFGLLWLGFGLCMRPLVRLAEWVPLLGRLVGGLAAVVSFCLAAVFSLLAISTGWLWHRALWLLGLLLLIGAVVFLLLRRRGAATADPLRAQMPPPPPPA
jgi:hypothetical protein